MQAKFFIYIRKSTDEPDRQILSIEAQVEELKEFAGKENLEIVKTFIESQTAKEPGRPVFNEMLSEIEKGKAEGILAWHPDRLARNSIDGGKIIYLVDTQKIKQLKFPTFWFENTPQGKFMLNIAFGQSKYFVDNLSENTKRGLRQKLRRGEWPGWAPIGYLNKEHKIIPDPERYKLIKKMFELYSTGKYSLKDLKELIFSSGLKSRAEKVLSVSMIQHTLANHFYYGAFIYHGELYQGTHKPIISKKLFDKVQGIMEDKSRPKKRSEKVYAFRGLFKCGECGCAITSEIQKGHNYYRCTKKKVPCSQKYVREETLAEQISDILKKVSLSDKWKDKMIEILEKEQIETDRAGFSFSQKLKSQIKECEEKLEKLLDAHLNSDISREEYLEKKQKILNQKIEISEKLKSFEKKGGNWLEPAKNFILASNQTQITALSDDLQRKSQFLKKAGSNLLLSNRKIKYFPRGAWEILENLPVSGAEPRSGEAKITFQKSENLQLLRR